MRIGIPREIKEHEYRVAATPAGVAELVAAGHQVAIEGGAGTAIGYPEEAYRAAGAAITDTDGVYAGDLVFKVKEPQPPEVARMRRGQLLFCYLHLASAPTLAQSLCDQGVAAIAFETVLDAAGHTPLLTPMSQIAGRMALQVGMRALEMAAGGRGVLLSGVPGVAPGRVAILGGGMVGGNAARMALGIGADVTLIERDANRLRAFDELYQGRLKTRFSSMANIEECVTQADLVIGATYLPGRRAPHLLSRELIRAMPRGAALVDVAIDQGGIAATSRATTHSAPFYLDEGVVHYGVTNMPGAVARTATLALSEITLPYLLRLAAGARDALLADAGFAAGLNVLDGQLVHAGLAEDLGKPAADWRALPL